MNNEKKWNAHGKNGNSQGVQGRKILFQSNLGIAAFKISNPGYSQTDMFTKASLIHATTSAFEFDPSAQDRLDILQIKWLRKIPLFPRLFLPRHLLPPMRQCTAMVS